MEMGKIGLENYQSLKQAIGIAALRKSLKQDASTLALVKDMQAVNAKIQEGSVSPHLGTKIDIRV